MPATFGAERNVYESYWVGTGFIAPASYIRYEIKIPCITQDFFAST
jgi:hypothetical protein